MKAMNFTLRTLVLYWIGEWVGRRSGLYTVVVKQTLLLLPGIEPPVVQPAATHFATELLWLPPTRTIANLKDFRTRDPVSSDPKDRHMGSMKKQF